MEGERGPSERGRAERGRIRYPVEAAPEPGEAVEIADGILWARLPLPMALDHVNLYALDDGDGWTVIDTGMDTKACRAAWDGLLAGPLAGRPVRRVILTHYHPDHVGLVGWLQDRGAELLTTPVTWTTARMLTLAVEDRPTETTLTYWRRAGMDPALLARRAAERPFNFADCVAPLTHPFRRIEEGDRIEAGGRTWEVRIGNGHAASHATLWSDDGAVVLGGDQLLPSISPNIGVYASEPEADPLREWLESCDRFLGDATEDRLVLPGHKLPYRGLPTRLVQLIENHEGALARLRRFLAEPRTAVEAFGTIFGHEIGASQHGFALVEAVAHMNRLWHAGEAVRTLGDDGAWRFRMA